MALTKAQIIEKVMHRNGFPKNKSTETVEVLLELIKRSLESGEDVLISGFGKRNEGAEILLPVKL
jgi:integration host factor subunit alpha